MFAPPLYKVYKFTLSFLEENEFHVDADTDIEEYLINQQDNMLFRQIRLITNSHSKKNTYIIFVDCKSGKTHRAAITELVTSGFYIGDRHYVCSERSASMVRTSILSFVDATISEHLVEHVTMGITVGETVLSKWYAYRGLMLSSCHCLEDWYPRIIIVPDLYKTIKNQTIKYAYDEHSYYEKDGEKFPWTQKNIAVGVRDIEINVADGCGIHDPDITDIVRGMLDSKTDPTSILWRAPFIKGVTHEFDYKRFFSERGVTEITDVWGVQHDVSPTSAPALILCESMYKGLKYFKQDGTYADWQNYWQLFRKYNHCIGVAKWNFSLQEEPMYTRGNYQILQDLDLPYEDFAMLAADSVEWIEKIMSGDKIALYVFLGLFADNHKGLNLHMESLVKNHNMIYEDGVRSYLKYLINKTIDDMKCGKIYLKACFKFLAPDLVMLAEHIGGLPTEGALEHDEFFSFNRDGMFSGEYLIERNPHICKSEHTILRAANNSLLQDYCSHLVNVCMINGKSITPQRLNGADFDGDLVLVIDNPLMMKGVHRDAPIVIDVEDKITTLQEADTLDNRVNVILRDKSNMIGEVSNYATAYHNKQPKSDDTRQMYESFVDLLSIINGKVIDSSKTGVVYNVPRFIAKYGRPLPYFMHYASPYYASMKRLSMSHSNMNLLCFELERWHKSYKFEKIDSHPFDYTIMMNNDIPFDANRFETIASIYKEYRRESNQLFKQFKRDMKRAANSKNKTKHFVSDVNWQAFYNKYRCKCFDACPNICELANYAVKLCYEIHPRHSKRFLWVVGGEGVLSNLQQTEQLLPISDPNGEYEYLGKRYRLEKIVW